MKTIIRITLISLTTIVFAACTKTVSTSLSTTLQPSTSPLPKIEVYRPTNPIEVFLVELTQTTKLPFKNPVKADIMWTEGETVSSRKFFFGDSFLIEYTNIKSSDEQIVANYFTANGFIKMPFDESVGDDKHSVGYRKNELVCKYDRSQYPEETAPHLNIYCTDATKGTERK